MSEAEVGRNSGSDKIYIAQYTVYDHNRGTLVAGYFMSWQKR